MPRHFDGKQYFNPGLPAERSFRDFLRWQFTANRTAWQRLPGQPKGAPPAAKARGRRRG